MKNILLIDDDNIFNFLNRKMLAKIGFVGDIKVATNGQQAMELLNDYYMGSLILPDVILLDLNMPVMDGFSFLEAFRRIANPRKNLVNIIIVTSSNDPKDKARAEALGITKFLVKPLSEDRLREAISDVS